MSSGSSNLSETTRTAPPVSKLPWDASPPASPPSPTPSVIPGATDILNSELGRFRDEQLFRANRWISDDTSQLIENYLSHFSEISSPETSIYNLQALDGNVHRSQSLLPGIVVMNHKYWALDLEREAPKNGDFAVTAQIIRVLKQRDAFHGMVLFQKNLEAAEPIISYEFLNGAHCEVIQWNEAQDVALLRIMMRQARRNLAARVDGPTRNRIPIFYHGDETLLLATPHGLPTAITHHAPILANIEHHFRADDVLMAFGTDTNSLENALREGGEAKVETVRKAQDGGLAFLKSNCCAYTLAMSENTASHFRSQGQHPERILYFQPPLKEMLTAHKNITAASKPLPGKTREFLIFFTVARFTWYKDAELFIQGVLLVLAQSDLNISVFMAGGTEKGAHQEVRQRHADQIPAAYRERFTIVPSMLQTDLYALFNSQRAQESGIFVCSSKYETLGIAPLEAALSGVTTLVTDTPLFEAARHFPEEFKFQPSAQGLADKLMSLLKQEEKSLQCRGQDLKAAIEAHIHGRSFEEDIVQSWKVISECHGRDSSELGEGSVRRSSSDTTRTTNSEPKHET